MPSIDLILWIYTDVQLLKMHIITYLSAKHIFRRQINDLMKWSST